MINIRNIQAMLKDLFDNDIMNFVGSNAPVSGTSGTGVGLGGPGSTYTDKVNARKYINLGTKASPNWLDLSFIKEKDVNISNTEMLALRATPKELVPASGQGFVNQFIRGALFFDRTAAYTESTDNLAIKFNDGAGAAVSETIETTGFLDAASDAYIAISPLNTPVVTLKSACDNLRLCLHNTGDGEFGGGNAANIVRCRIMYAVVNAGW